MNSSSITIFSEKVPRKDKVKSEQTIVLVSQDVKPKVQAPIRKSIPKTVRNNLWINTFGKIVLMVFAIVVVNKFILQNGMMAIYNL